MKLFVKDIKFISENIVIESDTDLKLPSIAGGNFTLGYFNDNVYTSIIINDTDISFPLSGDSNYKKAIILKTIPLIHNKIYQLSVFSIEADNGDIVAEQVFKFLSTKDFIDNIVNPNNIYTQIQNLDKILSLENLFKKSENYTFKFIPTTFDTTTQKIVPSNEEVVIYNNKNLLDKLISQYHSEYKDFYNIVNNREIEKLPSAFTFDDSYINNLHLSFMKNMPKWNSLKGNKFLIEIMIGYYARILGYNVISVVEDTAQNFSYRISSSIPLTFWNKKIKPFVHPLSWNCIYNEISSIINGPAIQLYNRKQSMRQLWKLDCISNIDAEMFSRSVISKDHIANLPYKKMKQLIHSSGVIESFNVSAHETIDHDLCTFDLYNGELKYNKLYSGRTETDHTYNDNNFLKKEILDLKNIIFSIDKKDNGDCFIELDFSKTGIANQYIYEIYDGNFLIDIIQSGTSKIKIPFSNSKFVLLKLKNNDWSYTVYRVDLSPFTFNKNVILSYKIRAKNDDFLNIRNSNTRLFQYNGMSISSMVSTGFSNALTQAQILEYDFYNPSFALDFQNEFITTSLLSTTSSVIGSYKKYVVDYAKPGVITKYKWDLYVNSVFVESTTTYINSVKFIIPTSAITPKVKLTVYHQAGSDTLSDYNLV